MSSPQAGTGAARSYVLGHSEFEMKRLATQAMLVDPMTRRFFQAAGIAPGMRVLDVGSGAGDVAFLAAGLVGDRGEIVGVDRVPEALERARTRAAGLSLRNATFQEGDPGQMKFDRPFDAVIGRYVLMFQDNPAMMLRRLAAHLKPGGTIVFHEPDWDGVRSFPPAPLYDRCCGWLVETLNRHGHESHMGLKLYAAFLEAGLPAPQLQVDALIGGGANCAEHVQLLTDVFRTMLPAMVQLGVTTAEEVGIETLHSRVHGEVVANNSVVVGRFEVGAWSRV